MSKPFANFEIIGFDEAIRTDIPAGRSRPFVRERGTDRCFLLDWGDTPDVAPDMQTWEQVKDYAAEGRLTLLDRPVPAFDGAVALFVSDELLASAKLALPSQAPVAEQSYVLDWQRLPGVATKMNVAIVPEALSIALLNEWTRALKQQIRAQLHHYFLHGDREARARAEQLAEMALFTAYDPNLRAGILLYFGVAVKEHSPERLENVFEVLCDRAPNWKWERFVEELGDVLKPQIPRPEGQLPEVKEVREAFLEARRAVARLDDLSAQLKHATTLADQMRQKYQLPAELTAKLTEKLKMRIETQRADSPRCEFEDDSIRLLVTDPLFYLPDVVAGRSKIVLDLINFAVKEEDWKLYSESPLGELSKQLSETVRSALEKSGATACV